MFLRQVASEGNNTVELLKRDAIFAFMELFSLRVWYHKPKPPAWRRVIVHIVIDNPILGQ